MATALAPVTPSAPARVLSTVLTAERLRDLAVAAPLLWWATYLTWGVGGREKHVLSIGLALLVPALGLLRPWEVLPRVELALVGWLAVAPFVVVATAPTGWEGADDAASYLFAVLSYAVLRAWAVDAGRRTLLLGLLVAAGGMEFAQGWLPWWGGMDPTKLFQGTFYWHNQAGAFLAAGAVAAVAALTFTRGPLAQLSWVVAPLAAAGTVFTTSRGAQLALCLGLLVVLLAALLNARRVVLVLRVVGASALSVVTAFLLTQPPFFPSGTSPWAGTAARAESFEGNGVQRLEDWRRGWEIFKHWPVSGAGFHSFSSATSVATTKRDGVVTSFAHNGFVQAAADGGLVLAVPLWTAVLLLLWVGLRRFLPSVRSGEAAGVAGAAVFVLLVLHSGMDFDWAYPALLALMAPVAVLVRGPSIVRRQRNWWPLVPVVGLVVVGVVGAWHGGMDLNAVVGERQ